MDVIFWTGIYGNLSRPIGPYQLAFWLRKHGYDCQVIDFVQRLSGPEIVEFTRKFITNNTICIGLSSTFWAEYRSGRFRASDKIPENLKYALDIIKSEYPKIKFVLGGNQVDYLNKETINLFDIVFSGAGEDTFLNYLEDIRKGKKQVFSLETRYGVPYKTGMLTGKFNIQENDHLFSDQDCIVDGETLPIEISRGCIFKCTYCQYPYIGKKKLDYVRHIDHIKNEMVHNYERFKTKNYFILDDTFNDTPVKMDMWFECTSSLNFDIEYTCYMRADLLSRNEDQIEKFKDSGLVSVFFGIESFHPETSKIIGKGWSGKEGKIFLPRLKNIWKNDVTIHLSFIVGFPEETREEYRETQSWCFENNMDSWIWQPLYINRTPRLFSSELEREPEKFGFSFIGDKWFNKRYSSATAFNLSVQLNQERNRLNTQKITTWGLLNLMSLGYTSEYLNNTYQHNIDLSLLASKEELFLDMYKSKLNSISV